MDKVINLAARRQDNDNDKEFLQLLDKDLKADQNIKEVPESVFERIARIKHQAQVARERTELQEM